MLDLPVARDLVGASRAPLARYAGAVTVADDIVRSRYVSLTTYRKDGTPVATPVWHVPRGAELWIVTEAGSGKVKRIRKNPQVLVQPCSFRGTVAPDAPSVTGSARLLDDDGTALARKLLARRYVMSRVGNWFARLLRLRRPPMIGIIVSL
ncbi:PPOX class F420-dependent oxidoreductase [Micromonospora zingiberis]|uniref:PPOX class F420-dependent oxidoreductase n=1 Tax=Micromonospora zingiberis TaxID=2053011 RepID=A0A4R0GS54_9ACTN|nr:PPOX class F420-dependent oxidoreductase [Micromonospora zingiberis]TCB98501.1 PPOX class F420-dependent oxidoreductase [Micromonospora zingiberis]